MSISVIMTSTLVTMETVPAALVPTHVYTPASASVALSIIIRDKNGLSEGLKISIPSPEESTLPSLRHVTSGVGMPLTSHSIFSLTPTIVFGVELTFVITGSAEEEKEGSGA